MSVRRDDDGVLTVDDPDQNVGYCIEPAATDLGISRVDMVDRHLLDLAGRGTLWHAHIDALLDARAEFQAEGGEQR